MANQIGKIIKIDKFTFRVDHNIPSLDFEYSLGINKVETLSKNFYLKLGRNEKRISFSATLFLEQLKEFEGLIAKVEARKPLKFSTLESTRTQKIIIDKFSSSVKDWVLVAQNKITFYTRTFSIGGVIL
ncbi:hypothetical protein NHP200010_13430 [Helicobacter bizzozeronii]|uniref:hypothetical protein n=1 Tax=Helicobacter bizzozeronii TaxID=56877 RepID=UPI00244D906E|nr:hypothetical protein [Helicobacter bizzozeronii]GMB93620.1 hypothetical protein NHP200010_13430 [Helicobacter bizzozeronii]